jgi:transposase
MPHSDSGACRTQKKQGGEGKHWLIPKMWQATSNEDKEVEMAQERLTLKKIREILRLKHEAGLSDRAIAGACKISNSTVGEYLRRAEGAGVSWPIPEVGEEELYWKLFPEKERPTEKKYPVPDWEEVRKELRQKGVTLRLLWIEYKEKYPDGYQYSRYCEYYQRWERGRGEPSMRNKHIGGEKMQVDYSGLKIPITNRETGETSLLSVFVAVLPASNYTYAEAQSSENQCNWNNGHVRALEYFGGVPAITVPDNLKTGVKKPNYYEPDINPAYQALAEHYHFAVLPARVKRPKDKAKGENAVQNVERWIIAPLRKKTFFDQHEVNLAIKKQLELLNNKEMQHVGRSRRQEFEEIDQPNLRPLPEKPYEYADRKLARVNIDYHIEYDKHLYSVPYTLCHQEVDIHATERMIEIFHRGKSVAIHPRNFGRGRYTTLREHMPSNHQFMDRVNGPQLVQWAATIGPYTEAFVSAALQSRSFPEQAYRPCLGVLNLAKKYGVAMLEQACRSAMDARTFSYKAVKEDLDWLVKHTVPAQSEPLPAHENIRGNVYYK